MQDVRSSAALIAAVLIVILARLSTASATPQQLSCTLTDTAEQLGAKSRPIAVVFDDDAKTLNAQDGARNYRFDNVSISNISISGEVDDVSLGIDRSSSGIVWQQYGPDKPVIEFGQCRRTNPPAPAAMH